MTCISKLHHVGLEGILNSFEDAQHVVVLAAKSWEKHFAPAWTEVPVGKDAIGNAAGASDFRTINGAILWPVTWCCTALIVPRLFPGHFPRLQHRTCLFRIFRLPFWALSPVLFCFPLEVISSYLQMWNPIIQWLAFVFPINIAILMYSPFWGKAVWNHDLECAGR
jgi:hypothetical protein